MIKSIADAWAALRVQMREARQVAGMTQEEAAGLMTDDAAVGERRSWLSRIENGRAIPSALTLVGMARAYGLTLVAVPPTKAGILSLTDDELQALLDAAQRDSIRLGPLDRARLRLALAKVVER